MQGLILLDKPSDMTSFGAVAQVRRIFGEKRSGHTGTLDPMATGVLPILLGRATRLSGLLLSADKRYTAAIELGVTTDTLDATGNVISRCKHNVSDAEFIAVLDSFKGMQKQIPPMFSALKKDGVRLYDLARQGVDIQRDERDVEIKQINLLGKSAAGHYIIDVLCSKGTYIRTLADDIGKKLGCGATLSALRRTCTGGFDISECVTLEKLKEQPQSYIISADRCVMHLKSAQITDNQRTRFLHGGELYFDRVKLEKKVKDGELIRIYDKAGVFLGLGKVSGDLIKVQCIIFED